MMRTTFPILRYSRSRGAPTDDLCQVTDRLYLPPLRNLPELGIDQAVGEEVGEVGREAGVAALHLRADGVETHEPRLEERPRHLLQRLAHPPVQLDLVVERAEDVGDRTLLCQRWQGNCNCSQVCNGLGYRRNAHLGRVGKQLMLAIGRFEVCHEKLRQNLSPVTSDIKLTLRYHISFELRRLGNVCDLPDGS